MVEVADHELHDLRIVAVVVIVVSSALRDGSVSFELGSAARSSCLQSAECSLVLFGLTLRYPESIGLECRAEVL